MIPNTRALLTSKLKWLIQITQKQSQKCQLKFWSLNQVLYTVVVNKNQAVRSSAYVCSSYSIVVSLCSPCRGWDEEPTRPHLSFLANQFSHRRQLQLLSSSISQLPPPRPRRRLISSDHYLCHHTALIDHSNHRSYLSTVEHSATCTGGYPVCKE